MELIFIGGWVVIRKLCSNIVNFRAGILILVSSDCYILFPVTDACILQIDR